MNELEDEIIKKCESIDKAKQDIDNIEIFEEIYSDFKIRYMPENFPKIIRDSEPSMTEEKQLPMTGMCFLLMTYSRRRRDVVCPRRVPLRFLQRSAVMKRSPYAVTRPIHGWISAEGFMIPFLLRQRTSVRIITQNIPTTGRMRL